MTIAISRQTIDIPHPTYDTTDNAVCSSGEVSYAKVMQQYLAS